MFPEDSVTARPAKKRRPPVGGLIVAAVIVMAMAANTASKGGGGPPGEVLGYMLGSAFAAAGLAWIVLWLAAIRPSGHKVGALYFGILLVAGVIAAIATPTRQAEGDMGKAADGMASAYAAAGKGDKIDTAPVADGQAGEVERFFRTYMATLAEDQKAYAQELAPLTLDKILSEQALKADPDLSRARTQVARAGAVVRRHRDLFFTRLDEAEKRIDTIPVPAAARAQFKAGFLNGVARSSASATELWDLEEAAVREMEGAVDVMAKSRGRWRYQGGELVFDRDRDLAAFNGHIQEMQRISKAQEALKASSRVQAEEGLQSMRKGGGPP